MAMLLVMRLADMKRVHPDQIEARCSKCNEVVGVYPSGQRVMREIPDVRLVCQMCNEPSDVQMLAPGALDEPAQTHRKTMTTEEIFHTIATAHNEALARGVLNIWTVYDRPADYPDSVVARRFEVGKHSKGLPTVTDDVVEGELQILRDCFTHCGLTCMQRQDGDEPQIVESWL